MSQSSHSPITLLVFNPMAEQHLDQIRQHATVIYAPTAAQRAQAVAEQGAEVDAVLTIGSIGLSADEVARMPRLRLACTLGAGYEGLALDALKARGAVVATGAGTNDTSVADHTFGLILATMRNFRSLDQQARAGVDRFTIPHPPGVSGKKLGIIGLGHIGLKIARRAAGFDMPVGYHNRKPKPDVQQPYFDSVLALAAWADVLVCATPGGAGTRHLVNAEVLRALGPQGYLINIARGSVVDTEALAAALQEGRIAGAGIDVYESEPHRPEPLIDLPNILITPHVAGWSPEATQASVDQFIGNLTGVFSGRGAVAPVDLG
ncbi:2-hydroxyacid dehydrogenase [Comamonas odontotermitis]|uniref:2-hydroxyacid dehydrogenase n=1 Tax=Comamonas odontotermitis TaxID=379895 RepID=UPI0021E13939|nr:2-hydroxyacid dehydrogenase [Comamonas odontotermitis]